MGDRQWVSRRGVVAGTVLGAAALGTSPARALTGGGSAGTAVRTAVPSWRRPRHRFEVRPLSSADGSMGLDWIRGVNRFGQVLGRVTVNEGSSSLSTSAIWTEGRLTVLAPPVAETVDIGVRSLNDWGQAVGTYTVAGRVSAAVWTHGVPRVLDIGTYYSDAQVINNRGQIVVRGWNEPPEETPTWNEMCLIDGDRATTIVPPESADGCELGARAINDRGEVLVVGYRPQNPGAWGFLWRDGRIVADFSHIDGDQSFSGLQDAAGLNARGQAVGDYMSPGERGWRTFFWSDGTLGNVVGLPDGDSDVGIFGNQPINDLGDVVGFSDIWPGRVRHPFLWSRGRTTDLGTLGGTSAHPVGVNNSREVAGNSTTADGAWHAFLWRRGEMIELPTPQGYDTSTAEWITEQGDVLGYAFTAGFKRIARFRWTVR